MKRFTAYLLLLAAIMGCSSDNSPAFTSEEIAQNAFTTKKILSLGDSYTIGESVCDPCKFPEQLKDSIKMYRPHGDVLELDVIAQTGWTTSSLLNAIDQSNIDSDYNLITLLIGVNNQYQGLPFSLYEIQFPQLINLAISKASGQANRLIVLSIPDYAYTPFGQMSSNPEGISADIDAYNDFAEAYCNTNGITFINITDITRLGLEETSLIANDGLHPSELAYSRFVQRILPAALQKIE